MSLRMAEANYNDLKNEFDEYKRETDKKIEELISRLENLQGVIQNCEDYFRALTGGDGVERHVLQTQEEKKNKIMEVCIVRYKKSILVKNRYENKNTTKNFKEMFKENGGKWFKTTDGSSGWLFVGKFDEKNDLMKNSDFIIKMIEKDNVQFGCTYEDDLEQILVWVEY